MIESHAHHLPMIVEACIRTGTPAEVRDNHIIVDGHDLNWELDYRSQNTKRDLYLSRSQQVKKYYFSIGSYGEKTVYKQKADGSFNWDGIAEKLILVAQKKDRQAERSDKTATNKPVADELREHLGLSPYSGPMTVAPSQYRTDLPLVVKIDISLSADVARAEEIYAGLVALGLIKPRTA